MYECELYRKFVMMHEYFLEPTSLSTGPMAEAHI